MNLTVTQIRCLSGDHEPVAAVRGQVPTAFLCEPDAEGRFQPSKWADHKNVAFCRHCRALYLP